MKKLAWFAFIEASLLVAGAGADRMLPEEIPTWAIWLGVVVCLGVSAVFYLWDRRDIAVDVTAIREAIQKELKDRDYRVEELRKTIKRLLQKPLGDGHTYTELPDGTRIVTMADGTIRLALPVRLSGVGETATSGAVSLKPPDGE